MIGYPFDSQVTFDAQGNPQYDRAVSSKPLKELIKKLFTTGVMPNPSTNLQVVEGVSGLTTIVKAGFCIIEGGLKLEEEDKTMMHQAADTTYDRIDTVVMRWNDNDNARICSLYVLEGTPSATPVRPTLNREGSVYEIGLADVLIKANSTAISQQRITDTRYETERCGVISSISEFDTDTIYAQVQADLAGFKADEEADFLAWFDEMKDQLSEDAAGNLQNQIGLLSNLQTTIKSSIVAAINEVFNKTPSDMIGATSEDAGIHGLVPAPQAGDENKCLKGDGTWGTVDASTVRYVPSTDKVQLWDGSDWVNWKTAGLKLNPVFANGVLSNFFSPLSITYKKVTYINTGSSNTYYRIENGLIKLSVQGTNNSSIDQYLIFLMTQQLNFAELYDTYHSMRVKGKVLRADQYTTGYFRFGIYDADGNSLTQKSLSATEGSDYPFNESVAIPSSGVGYIGFMRGRGNLGTGILQAQIESIEFEE